jgi:hypothetical protein
VVRERVGEVLLVDEGDIEQAIVLLLEVEKTVVEGAGAAGLACLLRYRERFAGKRIGLVLCGGNIDPLMLSDIIERGMVRSGRLTRLQVELRDLPGSLAQVTACLAEVNANIEEVHHQRAFTHVPVRTAEVDFVLETRGRPVAASRLASKSAIAGRNSPDPTRATGPGMRESIAAPAPRCREGPNTRIDGCRGRSWAPENWAENHGSRPRPGVYARGAARAGEPCPPRAHSARRGLWRGAELGRMWV